jgi:hypothetical protein
MNFYRVIFQIAKATHKAKDFDWSGTVMPEVLLTAENEGAAREEAVNRVKHGQYRLDGSPEIIEVNFILDPEIHWREVPYDPRKSAIRSIRFAIDSVLGTGLTQADVQALENYLFERLQPNSAWRVKHKILTAEDSKA